LGTAVVAAPAVLVDTRRVEAFPAELTAATADEKWSKHAVAHVDRNYVVANFFDDPHRFVADTGWDVAVAFAAIKPEVGATDRRVGDADDRATRGVEFRSRDGFDTDIAGAMKGGCAHTEAGGSADKNPSLTQNGRGTYF